MTRQTDYCYWCGREHCVDPDACQEALDWERSVLCQRCNQPSGIHPMTLKANGAVSVTCADCAKAVGPVDP